MTPSKAAVAGTSPVSLVSLEALRDAGLTGRGGAAFATHVKVAAARERGATLIVNACDGELDAAKDAWVVEHHLPQLRHGAALVCSGRIRYAAHRGGATAARLSQAGLDVLELPRRYVSSEESAIASYAAGGLARPLTKRTPIAFGARHASGRPIEPTVVLNAETLWRVAQISAHGPDWFRRFGTPAEPGPRLVTVAAHGRAPVVLQTHAGAPVTDLLAAAGRSVGELVAVNVGGLGGTWLTAAQAAGVRWSRESLAPFGASIGPGVLRLLEHGRCPVCHAADLVDYAAGESAGQCGPCMFGLPAVAADLRAIADRRADAHALDRLRHRVGALPGRGACRFPDGVAGFVAGLLSAFNDEVTTHLHGRCALAYREHEHRHTVREGVREGAGHVD